MKMPELDDFPHVQDERLRLLLNHWLEARRGRQLPARRDIDPTRIRSALPVVWMCDYEPDGRLPIRLMGEEVRERYGCDVRGRNLLDFFPEPERSRIPYWLGLLPDDRCVTHAIGKIVSAGGAAGLGERLHLPLADDGVTPDAVIGATAHAFETPVACARSMLAYGEPLANHEVIGTRTPVDGRPGIVEGADGKPIVVQWKQPAPVR